MRHTSMRMRWAAAWLIGAVLVSGIVVSPPTVWADDLKNQIFFRGGGVYFPAGRADQPFTDLNCGLGHGPCNNGTSGYYVGAGLDLEAHKDFLGIKGMTLHGEIATLFARLNSSSVINTPAALVGQTSIKQQELTIFNLTISPKLKFNHGGKFRPWIIPIGLSYIVLSPPSGNSNYLDFGAVFGAGAEYNFYGPFNLGVEARWNLSSNQTGAQTSFGIAGAYLGILF